MKSKGAIVYWRGRMMEKNCKQYEDEGLVKSLRRAADMIEDSHMESVAAITWREAHKAKAIKLAKRALAKSEAR